MPTISEFFGIAVRMYYDDHEPAHFHVYYGEHAAEIEIETLRVRHGQLPRRALALVLEWALQHRDALRVNWTRARAHELLSAIPPLEVEHGMEKLLTVEPLPDYRLRVSFEDGTEGVVDLKDRLFGPMFEPLLDPELFGQVAIDEFGAPRWPNGADLGPTRCTSR